MYYIFGTYLSDNWKFYGSECSIEDHFFTFGDVQLCTFINIPTPESPSVQFVSISGTSLGGKVMKDV